MSSRVEVLGDGLLEQRLQVRRLQVAHENLIESHKLPPAHILFQLPSDLEGLIHDFIEFILHIDVRWLLSIEAVEVLRDLSLLPVLVVFLVDAESSQVFTQPVLVVLERLRCDYV